MLTGKLRINYGIETLPINEVKSVDSEFDSVLGLKAFPLDP